MARKTAFLLFPSVTLLLGACAASTDYPSLTRRPAERISGSAQAAAAQPAPAPAPPPSPEFTTRLTQLVEQARGAHRRFDGQRAQTERLVSVAAGAAVASESWAVASVALASLESARSDAMVALAELDQIHAAEAIAASTNRDAAANARDQVVALVGEEDDVLARLRGRLRS